jgi:hypothetical protein
LRCLCALHLLLFILCTTTAIIAQSTDATVSGLVLDPSGRAIPDAEILILNDATGVRYPSATNKEGLYTVSILPPGQYRVQVSKGGFKTIIKPGVILNIQSAVVLNFTLPIGAASETVTVDDGSSRINTTDGSVSTVIDQTFVEHIPLNGRSFQDLISLTPGVVTQSPQSGSSLAFNGDFSVNGQRTESNYYTVDGVSGNISAGNGYGGAQSAAGGGLAASTALGTTQGLVSIDALQEFRIQSSSYSAEYGRSPGGQFSFLTKSGANDFHVGTFDYLRNNYLDANDWFNDHYAQPIAALRQNDFGGTAGGPIWIPRTYNGKDKTFFFVSYEGLRLTQPQPAQVLYVPDTYMRQQAPAALQPILSAFPVQNSTDYGTISSPSLAEFIKSYALPSRINSTSVRVDQQIRPKFSLFFRYADTPSSTEARSYSVVSQTQINTQTYTLGATNQIASGISNELRLGYAHSDTMLDGTLDGFGGATPINLAQAMGIQSPRPYPEFVIIISGVSASVLTYSDSSNNGHQWNVVDTFSLSKGQHHIELGVDYRRIKTALDPASTFVPALYESSMSVIQNTATFAEIGQRLPAVPLFNEMATFFQDEWRVSSVVALSLGLRWEVDPPPTGANGKDAYTLSGNIDDPSSLSLAPQGTPLWKTPWNNFAPRLGVAWQAHTTPGWETVVRSGGGVFFDTDNGEPATLGFTNLGFSSTSVLFGVPLPLTPAQLDFAPSTAPPYTNAAVSAYPSHLQLPYTLQWNVSVQQSMGREQAFTLSYVGANGRRLVGTQEIESNPDFGYIYYFPGNITSNYQALQAQFQRSVVHGIQALASYTWSHSLDFGSNDTVLPLTRGNSDFDVRDNFSGGLSWNVPAGTSSGLSKLICKDWGLDGRFTARSAFPVPLQGNLLVNPATGSQYYNNLNYDSSKPLYLRESQFPGNRAINPAAFSLPTGTVPGTAPRNFVRGFGETQINLAARRDFRLHERLTLQFRAEAFNIVNHPNFGYIDPTLTDAQFGQATKMLNQSLGTVASQYQQGGPRSMQFALKVFF